jgi:hypothetical protein
VSEPASGPFASDASSTQVASQVVAQQWGSALQTAVVQGSHVETRAGPVMHGECAHVSPLDELVLLDELALLALLAELLALELLVVELLVVEPVELVDAPVARTRRRRRRRQRARTKAEHRNPFPETARLTRCPTRRPSSDVYALRRDERPPPGPST